jgi:hypothetical protein
VLERIVVDQTVAREAGLAWRTVERAKHSLGVEATRVGGAAGDGQWWWRLPPAKTDSASAKTANTSDVAVLASTTVISAEKPDATPKTATSKELAALDRLELTLWPHPR